MKVEFFKHSLGKAERDSLDKTLRSLYLTTGKQVDIFEKGLAAYSGVSQAVGLTSCTAAMHLALLAAGIGEGDEVITTPMTFVATSHAILMAGATPVFVDVEPATGNIDAARISAAITKKTKAILPVHLYGQMADMKTILAIAKKHKLVVIEDAAHVLEASRDGVRPGARSFGACLSFYATKSITSGEGGAFITNNAQAAKMVTRLRLHGVNRELVQRERTKLNTYDITELGWKYNMDNIDAALLTPQLKTIKRNHARRMAIAKRYRAAFEGLVDMPAMLPNSVHAHHLFPIWVNAKHRDRIALVLKEKGVGVSVVHYPPVHLLEYYKKRFGYKKGDFPLAESIGPRAISLPLYPLLTDKEIEYVIKEVRAAVIQYS
ncbi:MAG TPA: DegT/DnrJ/EryC1/StrS family aminotransferase [Candidatus Paceibacterota bacterium]|nr:DegT/DnrJ/EryC1/StrS family aminotransferase [Candidatus Paceibacterota bacterium]